MQNVRNLPSGQPYTDCSGTIATGGTSQQITTANGARSYLLIQATSASALWIGVGATAVADSPSIYIPAGGNWEPLVPPTQALHVLCATTGAKYTAKEA